MINELSTKKSPTRICLQRRCEKHDNRRVILVLSQSATTCPVDVLTTYDRRLIVTKELRILQNRNLAFLYLFFLPLSNTWAVTCFQLKASRTERERSVERNRRRAPGVAPVDGQGNWRRGRGRARALTVRFSSTISGICLLASFTGSSSRQTLTSLAIVRLSVRGRLILRCTTDFSSNLPRRSPARSPARYLPAN